MSFIGRQDRMLLAVSRAALIVIFTPQIFYLMDLPSGREELVE